MAILIRVLAKLAFFILACTLKHNLDDKLFLDLFHNIHHLQVDHIQHNFTLSIQYGKDGHQHLRKSGDIL